MEKMIIEVLLNEFKSARKRLRTVMRMSEEKTVQHCLELLEKDLDETISATELSVCTDENILNKEDFEVIRELLTEVACGYERKDFYYHCCDANEVIKKIDKVLGV